MSATRGLDLPKLVSLIKARARLLVAITLNAAGLAFVVSLGQSEQFRATSVLLFGGAPQAEALVTGREAEGAELEASPHSLLGRLLALELGTLAGKTVAMQGAGNTEQLQEYAKQLAPMGQMGLKMFQNFMEGARKAGERSAGDDKPDA